MSTHLHLTLHTFLTHRSSHTDHDPHTPITTTPLTAQSASPHTPTPSRNSLPPCRSETKLHRPYPHHTPPLQCSSAQDVSASGEGQSAGIFTQLHTPCPLLSCPSLPCLPLPSYSHLHKRQNYLFLWLIKEKQWFGTTKFRHAKSPPQSGSHPAPLPTSETHALITAVRVGVWWWLRRVFEELPPLSSSLLGQEYLQPGQERSEMDIHTLLT